MAKLPSAIFFAFFLDFSVERFGTFRLFIYFCTIKCITFNFDAYE